MTFTVSGCEPADVPAVPPFLGMTEVARLVGVQISTVMRACDRGRLPYVRDERGRRQIPREAAEAYRDSPAPRAHRGRRGEPKPKPEPKRPFDRYDTEEL